MYITVDHVVDRSLSSGEVVAVRRVGVFVLVDLRSQICVCGVIIYK